MLSVIFVMLERVLNLIRMCFNMMSDGFAASLEESEVLKGWECHTSLYRLLKGFLFCNSLNNEW